MAPRLVFSPFEGDFGAKTCVVTLDGATLAHIEVINVEEFQGRGTMRRTRRFEEVTLALVGKYTREDRDTSFHAADGYTRASGIAAAKALLKEWVNEISTHPPLGYMQGRHG